MASLKLIARRFPEPRNTEAFGRPKLHAMHGGNESQFWLEHMSPFPSIRCSAKGNSKLTPRSLGGEAKSNPSRRSHILEGRKPNPLFLPAFHFPIPHQRIPCGLIPISELQVPKARMDQHINKGPGARLSLPVL